MIHGGHLFWATAQGSEAAEGAVCVFLTAGWDHRRAKWSPQKDSFHMLIKSVLLSEWISNVSHLGLKLISGELELVFNNGYVKIVKSICLWPKFFFLINITAFIYANKIFFQQL